MMITNFFTFFQYNKLFPNKELKLCVRQTTGFIYSHNNTEELLWAIIYIYTPAGSKTLQSFYSLRPKNSGPVWNTEFNVIVQSEPFVFKWAFLSPSCEELGVSCSVKVALRFFLKSQCCQCKAVHDFHIDYVCNCVI